LLGLLVDEGKLDWDEPVASYLPDFKLYDEYATAHLTPRDMVCHRSGLPRHDLVWYNDEEITRAELVRRLRFLEPNEDLRAAWQYNNLMYLTAGYLIEQLTGTAWEEAVRRRVLEPLGMRRTNFSVFDSQKDDDHALPYLEDDDELRKIAFRPIGVMGPAGSINSCVDEMARWVNLHLGGGSFDGKPVIQAGTLRAMHTPQMVMPGLPQEEWVSPASYGLGWMIDTWRGRYRVHHGGNIDG
jgi:CubicO group peptidase (beta-lactamase class C family)